MRRTTALAGSTMLGVLALGFSHGAASGQDGPRIRVDAAEITFAGRVQMQFNTSSVDDVAPSEMILRRVRFGANLRINETVSGRIHPELSAQTLSLADAYMALQFSPAFQLWAGRAHRPFTVMEFTSSTQIIPIERGVRIRGLAEHDLSSLLNTLRYTDRDVGLQLRGTPAGLPLGFNYALAIVSGPLQGAVGGEFSAQFVARAAVAPFDRTRIGAAWTRRDFAVTTAGRHQLRAGDAWAVDLEYGATIPNQGPHLVAELVLGDVDPFVSRGFRGGQLWAGYRFAGSGRAVTVEPLLRLSHADIDESALDPSTGGTLVTPGLNIYFGGLNRLMLNLDLWNSASASDELSFKSQFQLAF